MPFVTFVASSCSYSMFFPVLQWASPTLNFMGLQDCCQLAGGTQTEPKVSKEDEADSVFVPPK